MPGFAVVRPSKFKSNSKLYLAIIFVIGIIASLIIRLELSPKLIPNIDNQGLLITKQESSLNSTATTSTASVYEILSTSSKKAFKGGIAGASAAVVQVLALMWLRTIMNYQYRYGGTISGAFNTLYSEGGIGRLYRGLSFAIVQGPMTRFGDTAANMGMLALLDTLPVTNALPLFAKTLAGSLAAGGFRIVLMPIDTSKTVLQVEGREGFNRLILDVQSRKTLSPFYRGAFATAAATAVGHYPWFLTYNFLDEYLPVITSKEKILLLLLRSAFLGLAASCTSDICSNSLRVIKTTKQTAALNDVEKKDLSYTATVKLIIEKDGFQGLFVRGLKTRLITNMIQGALFSVLWKYFQSIQA